MFDGAGKLQRRAISAAAAKKIKRAQLLAERRRGREGAMPVCGHRKVLRRKARAPPKVDGLAANDFGQNLHLFRPISPIHYSFLAVWPSQTSRSSQCGKLRKKEKKRKKKKETRAFVHAICRALFGHRDRFYQQVAEEVVFLRRAVHLARWHWRAASQREAAQAAVRFQNNGHYHCSMRAGAQWRLLQLPDHCVLQSQPLFGDPQDLLQARRQL